MFSKTWDAFADLFELVKNPVPPRFDTVLGGFGRDVVQRGTPWKSIHKDHPRIMYEGVLYAAGQHRFKIFRIRTYIVLAWAADGMNLYEYPVPFVDSNPQGSLSPLSALEARTNDGSADSGAKKDDNPPTWYRRVLCAIPKPYSGWTATLLWPSSGNGRLVVVMFPSNPKKTAAPAILFCPATADKLNPDETRTKITAGHLVHRDGWIRSHAAGCAYHLRN